MREKEETQEISHLSIKERASIFTSWKNIEQLQILCNEIEESSENHKEIRTKFDLLLSICGMDIMLGGTIFKSYIEYEFDELADAIETNASDTIIKELKQYIIQLIHRQLSLPLIGNEIALQSYSQLLSEYYNENDEKIINPQKLLIKYNEGLDKRAARLVYEDKLYPTSSSDTADKDTTATTTDTTYNDSNTNNIDVWRAYIKFEMSDNEYSRVQRLYKRATGELSTGTSTRPPSDVISSTSSSTDSSEVYTLWSEYINFAVYTIKNWLLVEEVTTKALRITINRSDIYLWKYHLYSLEKNGHNYDRIYETIQQAMTVTFPSADSYLDIQCHLADYCSRRLTARQASLLHTTTTTTTPTNITYTFNNNTTNSNNTSDTNDDTVLIEQSRNSLVLIETLLTTYYPDWAAGWLRYYKYTIHINNLILQLQHEYIQQYHIALTENSNNTIKLYTPIKTIYEQAVLKFGIYSYIWMEFTTWLKGLYLYDQCRKVYKRGIAAVSTNEAKVELAREWVSFEGMCGSIEDILQALKATKIHLAPPSTTTTTAAAAAPSTSSDKAEVYKKTITSKTVSAPVKSILKPASTTTTSSSTTSSNNKDNNNKRKQDQLATTGSAADAKYTTRSDESKSKRVRIQEEESQNYERLLIRNLPFTASVQDIYDFLLASAPSLSSFLASSRLDLVLSKAGKSRGLIVVNPPPTPQPTTTESIYTDMNNNDNTDTTNATTTDAAESGVNGGERGGIEGLLALNGNEYNGRALVIERLTPTLTEAHGIHFHTPLIPSSHTTTAATYTHTPVNDTNTHTTPPFLPAAAGVAVAVTKPNSAQHPTTVFVSKLPKDYTNDQLYTLFAQCGPIVAAKITKDKKTGESKVSQYYNLLPL